MKKLILIIAVVFPLVFQDMILGQEADKEIVPTRWLLVKPPQSCWEENNLRFTYFIRDDMGLRFKNLYAVEIKGRKLCNVDFTGSSIVNADFSHTTFVRCNFSQTWINNVKTDEKTEFVDCNFDGARIHHFDFTKFPPEVAKAVLETKDNLSDLSHEPIECYTAFPPVFPDLYYKGIEPSKDYSNVRLLNRQIGLTKEQFRQSVNYEEKLLKDIIFSGVYNCDAKQFDFLDYSELDLSNMVVSDVLFANVDFKNANFTDAKLIGVEFHNVKNLTAEQIMSTWNWKNNAMHWFPLSTLEFFKNELGLDLTERVAR